MVGDKQGILNTGSSGGSWHCVFPSTLPPIVTWAAYYSFKGSILSYPELSFNSSLLITSRSRDNYFLKDFLRNFYFLNI